MKKLTQILTAQHTPGTMLGITTALLLGCGITSAQGQAAAAPPPPPPETLAWVTTAAAGVTLTRGNSDTFLATLSLDTKRKWEKDEVDLGVSGGYGDNTVNNVEHQQHGVRCRAMGSITTCSPTGSTAPCGWTDSMMASPASSTASKSAPWPGIT